MIDAKYIALEEKYKELKNQYRYAQNIIGGLNELLQARGKQIADARRELDKAIAAYNSLAVLTGYKLVKEG